MKRKMVFLILSCLMLTTLLFASCSNSSSSTNAPSSTVTTSATTAANWWGKIGTPQYGGTITLRLTKDITNWDPYMNNFIVGIESGWMEKMTSDDWTLDPSTFSYQMMYRPSNFVKGYLAADWEFTDPSTYVIHLRQGIHWQNIAPANGRELVADDIVFHFMRMYDPTSGLFNKFGGPHAEQPNMPSLLSVTATDKYTVVFKWKTSNPEFITECLQLSATSEMCIENPDAVKQWGDVNDWHHAIGTGPFMLTEFVSGTSATMVKNPNYWGFDERYPKNQLPYVDSVKYLIIPDDATAISAMRTGKIDVIDNLAYQAAQDVNKTNPSIVQLTIPFSAGLSIDPRNDVKPFNDINVRKALQMALDLPTIAKTYYNGTTSPNPVALTSQYMTGWGDPYQNWPQSLKDEYAYNPTQAKALLAAAGYPNGFDTDIVVDSVYDMGLLQIVKSYFTAVGVNMDIKTMDNASWNAFVSTNYKQDALASLSTGGVMGKTNEPILQLQKFLSGSNNQYLRVNDPHYDTFYPAALAATSVDQVKQIVSDCNLYIAQQHFTVSLLQPMTFSLVQPWLKGYNGQYGSTYGNWGPSILGFYTSRFWIDQGLKKSMGY